MLQTRLFSDYGYVSKIGDEYKVVRMKFKLNPALLDRTYTKKGEAGNEFKLVDNLIRAKRTVVELALCNEWNYFVTLTIDPSKRDSFDLQAFHSDLSQMIKNLNKTVYHSTVKIKYLLIPELHKSGACHMHGFLAGLLPEELHLFTLDEILPYKIRNRIKSGRKVFSWKDYARNFGHCDLEYIESKEGAAAYMTKYIQKEMVNTVKELNAHTYYHSRGLLLPERIHEGFMFRSPSSLTFENEYCAISRHKSLDEIRALFENGESL